MSEIRRDIEEIEEQVLDLNTFADDIEDSLQNCETELDELATHQLGGLLEKLNFEEVIKEVKNIHVENIRELGEAMLQNNEGFTEVNAAIEGKMSK